VDIRTIMGTSTYPYTFLVGHEDKDMVHRLKITAFSDKPRSSRAVAESTST